MLTIVLRVGATVIGRSVDRATGGRLSIGTVKEDVILFTIIIVSVVLSHMCIVLIHPSFTTLASVEVFIVGSCWDTVRKLDFIRCIWCFMKNSLLLEAVQAKGG